MPIDLLHRRRSRKLPSWPIESFEQNFKILVIMKWTNQHSTLSSPSTITVWCKMFTSGTMVKLVQIINGWDHNALADDVTLFRWLQIVLRDNQVRSFFLLKKTEPKIVWWGEGVVSFKVDIHQKVVKHWMLVFVIISCNYGDGWCFAWFHEGSDAVNVHVLLCITGLFEGDAYEYVPGRNMEMDEVHNTRTKRKRGRPPKYSGL